MNIGGGCRTRKKGLIGAGGRKIRGLQQEIGGRRGIGHGYDTNAFNAYLAPKGQGDGIEVVVHKLWDGQDRWSDVEIKAALLDLLQEAQKPTDIRDYVWNNRLRKMFERRSSIIDEQHRDEEELRHRYENQGDEEGRIETPQTGTTEDYDPLLGDYDANEPLPFQKVEGEKGALTKEETALRDALVERAGLPQSTVMDAEKGQYVLDTDRDRRARMMGTSPKTIAAYRNGLDVEYTDKNGEAKTMRLHAPLQQIESMQAEKIANHSLSRDDQKKIYFSFKPEVNDSTGEEVEFYHSTFGKNHRDGGLFEKIVPQIRDLFKTSILAFSEPENLSGQIRPDGTIHKEHRGFIGYGNYLNKVLIDGKEYYVRFTIQRKKNESGLHSSFVSNVELYENPIAVAYVPSQGRGRLDYDRITDAKLKIYFDKCKENAEKLLSISNKNEGTTLNLHKVFDTTEEKENTSLIFDTAKKKFGLTSDLREAGYILPDGTMLDFSGRHELFGADDSGIRGRRTTDHRGISSVAYAYDAEGNEYDTGVETSMPDFIERGAIRIDANVGTINLNGKPTAQQRAVLRRLIQRSGGDVIIDYGNGWDSQHYSEYEGAKTNRVLSDIDRYFDEGIKTEGNIRYFRTSNGEAYGFILNGKIYIDPRIAKADTPIHEYTHLWAEGMRESDPEGWRKVVDIMRGEKELWEDIKSRYPELKTDDEIADEVLAHYSGTRGAERLREEMRKIAEGDGTLDEKTRAVAALENVRRALNTFWKKVAERLGIKFTTAEDVADMVMRDYLNNVDPMENVVGERMAEPGVRRQDVRKGDVFFSNAEKAVEGISQKKATGDQWLAMIQKAGGLKAGEDKWMGLSDWLKERNGKPVTKEELMDFIRQNQVQVEEVNYTENSDVDKNERMAELREEFLNLVEEGDEATGSIYISDHADWALQQMIDSYGDDFGEAFEWTKDSNGYPMLEAISDWDGNVSEAARYYLGIEDKPINPTRESYTTDGLDNKKEIALTVPTIESWSESDEIHFGDAGGGRAVAWSRFGDTTDADGNRVLVIDEIQSKRHQEGREKGYYDVEEIRNLRKEYENLGREQYSLFANAPEEARENRTHQIQYLYSADAPEGIRERFFAIDERQREILKQIDSAMKYGSKVPDAPFDKNWHELAMKRMLRYAAENGYDKVAWTKGEQQAKRYDLAAVVDNIAYVELPNGEIDARLYIKGDGGYQFLGRTWEEVEKSIGKDLTRRMKQGESSRTDTKEWGRDKDDEPIFYDYNIIEGDGLQIGGEGMKGFYDQMLPRFMDKYGKKWGVKTGEVELPNVEEAGRKMWSVDVTPEMRESVLQGQPMFHFAETKEDFDAIRDKAVEETGTVMSGLADKEVEIVKVGRHDFTGTGNQAIEKARKWAYDKLLKEHTAHKGTPDEFKYTIDDDSIEKFLSASSTKNSENLGVHLAVLKKLTKVIDGCIDVEIHPDYKKIGKVRKPENGINDPNMLIHRMYGAVNIDDVTRLVKVTMQEHRDKEGHAYDYRVTKIDLPISGSSTTNALGKPIISGANLLKDVEKSYDPGKYILAESAKLDEANNISEKTDNVSGVDFVGESVSYNNKPIQLSDYVARRIQKISDNFTDEQKEKILAGYNKVKNERPEAIAMIKTPEGYVLINKDMQQLCKAMNMPVTPYLRIKENDLDLVLPSLIKQGKAVGIVDIANISTEEAARVVPLRPETKTPTPPVEKAEAKPVSPAIDLDEVAEIRTEAENDGFAEGIGITLKMKDGNEYHLWVDTEDEKEDYFGTVEFYDNNDEDIPGEEMTKRFSKFFGAHISNIFGSGIGKAILSRGRRGMTLSSENLKMLAGMKGTTPPVEKAAVQPMPQPNTAAPEKKPQPNTDVVPEKKPRRREKDTGLYGWSDVRRSSYWNEKPEFKSVSDAAWWCYDLIGSVRNANEGSKFYIGKDYSRLLSMDDSEGEKVDVEKAKKHAGMVIPMAEQIKKRLIVARDRSKSEAAARYVQNLIDECDNAIDWYQRAAKGDRTIFDDERPRMFRISRDGKGLDKKTVDGNWTESEVQQLGEKLGGGKVHIETEETIPDDVRNRLLLGENVKGW